MRALLILMSLFIVSSANAKLLSLTGIASSATYPLLLTISTSENMKKAGIEANIASLGSAAALNLVKKGVIDFSVGEIPLKDEDLALNNLSQIKILRNEIVIVYNHPDINKLIINNNNLIDIFSGKIIYFNDENLLLDNLNLLNLGDKIMVLARSDGSGTTYNFLSHMEQFNNNIVASAFFIFPDKAILTKGSSGIAKLIQQNKGSISYLDSSYADKNNLKQAHLERPIYGSIYIVFKENKKEDIERYVNELIKEKELIKKFNFLLP